MAERELKRKSTTTRQQPEVEATDSAESTASADELKAELDDLLDEIDDILETNAEDFVKSYIQKGGQ